MRPGVAPRIPTALFAAALAITAMVAGCAQDTPTKPGNPNPSENCTFTVGDGPSSAIAGTGAEFTISITTAATCSWTATSGASFVAIVGPASGTGNGTVRFAVQSNTGPARQGTVQVAGRTLTINQELGTPAACDFAVSPTAAAVVKQGADVSLDVTITRGNNCAWTAAANDSFITVKSGASGSGAGTVVLSVAANSGAARVGTATVASQTITIAQESAVSAPCTLTASPTQVTAPAGGTNQLITIAVTQGDSCPWTAQSQSAFVTLSAAAGVGSGSVNLTVAANTGAARTGTALIAGQTVTVNQSAASTTGPAAVLSYQSDVGDFIGAGQSNTYVLQASQYSATIDGGRTDLTFSTLSGSGTSWNLRFKSPSGQQLTPGFFDTTARAGFQSPSQPGLDFSGNGRGCNKSTGRFLIAEATFGPGNTIQRFHARFEQHCEGWSVALHGEIWIDAQGSTTVPTMAQLPSGPGSPTTFFSYQSDPGDFVGNGGSQTYTLANAKVRAWASDTRPAVNIFMQALSGGAFFWTLDFDSASGAQLQPGTYNNAIRYPFNGAGVPGLSVTGGSGCNTLTGSFIVLEAAYGPQGEVLRFHATFEQHCNGAVPALRGEVYIVANPWK